MVIKNDKREIMITSIPFIPYLLEREITEFHATRYGLSLVRDIHFQDIILELDCLIAVSSIN